MSFFDKLKQVFKGKDNTSEQNVAESLIEGNKDALNENAVYPDEAQSSGNNEIDPDAEYVPDLSKNEGSIGEEFNLLNAVDMEEPASKIEESKKENNNTPDYDKEIEELLKQDAAVEIEDVDYEYINDVSVYDTLRNDKKDIINEINAELEKNNDISSDENNSDNEGINKIYIVLIGVISVLIIAIIIFVFAAAPSKKPKKASGNSSKSDIIDFTEYKSNKANYIYLSQKKEFDGQTFELSKMLVDSKATLFYFNNKFDIQKYNIILSDNNDIVYGMDLSFIQNMSVSQEEEKSTVLRFEPINTNAKSIKLSLYNIETGKEIDFKFDFNGNIQETPVKYIFDKSASSENSDVKINIDNMVFSSAGSIVNYTIQSAGNGFSIVQEKGKNGNVVVLEENATTIKKLKKYPSIYTFNSGNVTLGRMDFDSIEDLNSKIYLTFNDIFKSYAVNRDISANTLFSSNEKKPISFEVGNYVVVLEGLQFQNNGAVLVFHGEDKNVKFDEKQPNANRVEVRLDAQIVSTTSSGMEVILDGVCQSAYYGTDMVFAINERNRDLFYGLGVGNVSVRVNAVLVKTDDAKFEFDLRKAETKNNNDREKACDDIIDIFEGRLAYKSGEKSIESVMGFNEQIIKNGDVLSEYAPVQTTEKAQYSAQIVSSALQGNKFYAVVQEVWKGVVGIEETHFYRTHKIVAQKGDYLWEIIEDNVIK